MPIWPNMCDYVINASQRRPHNYRNNSFTTERTVWYHVPRRCYYAVGSMVSCINPVKNFGLRLSLFLRLTWPTAPTWRRTGKVEAPQGPKVPMPPVPGENIGWVYYLDFFEQSAKMLVVCTNERCCHLYLSLKSRRSPASRWSRRFRSCKAVRRKMLQKASTFEKRKKDKYKPAFLIFEDSLDWEGRW